MALLLAPNERIILKLRPAWRYYYPWQIASGFAALFTASSGAPDAAIVIVLTVAAITAVYRLRYLYYVTNQRAVMQVGLIARNTNEMHIRHIRGMTIRQSVIERVLGIGSLQLVSAADGVAEVIWAGINDPVRIKEIVRTI